MEVSLEQGIYWNCFNKSTYVIFFIRKLQMLCRQKRGRNDLTVRIKNVTRENCNIRTVIVLELHSRENCNIRTVIVLELHLYSYVSSSVLELLSFVFLSHIHIA